MPFVRGQAIRWISDDPQPGLIEVIMTDANARQWTFVDKAPVFTAVLLSAKTRYPVPVEIACTIVSKHVERNRQEVVAISTAAPWGLESTDGQSEFAVSRSQLVETPPV